MTKLDCQHSSTQVPVLILYSPNVNQTLVCCYSSLLSPLDPLSNRIGRRHSIHQKNHSAGCISSQQAAAPPQLRLQEVRGQWQARLKINCTNRSTHLYWSCTWVWLDSAHYTFHLHVQKFVGICNIARLTKMPVFRQGPLSNMTFGADWIYI